MKGEGAERENAPLVRIVDDERSVRDAIVDLMASVGMRTCCYSSASEFLRGDDTAIPGCVVLDVRMPEMSGFDLVAELTERRDRLPIVFVTGHGDMPMAVRAMKAGAVDFLAKPFHDQQLIDAVNAAIRRDLARRYDDAPAEAAYARLETLSEGERDVLRLIVAGLKIKQIAGELGISEITVKVRKARVLQKMEVASTVDLVRIHDLGISRETRQATIK